MTTIRENNKEMSERKSKEEEFVRLGGELGIKRCDIERVIGGGKVVVSKEVVVKYSRMVLPWTGVVCESNCKRIKNYGDVYSQCDSVFVEGSEFCKGCKDKAELKTVKDRVEGGIDAKEYLGKVVKEYKSEFHNKIRSMMNKHHVGLGKGTEAWDEKYAEIEEYYKEEVRRRKKEATGCELGDEIFEKEVKKVRKTKKSVEVTDTDSGEDAPKKRRGRPKKEETATKSSDFLSSLVSGDEKPTEQQIRAMLNGDMKPLLIKLKLEVQKKNDNMIALLKHYGYLNEEDGGVEESKESEEMPSLELEEEDEEEDEEESLDCVNLEWEGKSYARVEAKNESDRHDVYDKETSDKVGEWDGERLLPLEEC